MVQRILRTLIPISGTMLSATQAPPNPPVSPSAHGSAASPSISERESPRETESTISGYTSLVSLRSSSQAGRPGRVRFATSVGYFQHMNTSHYSESTIGVVVVDKNTVSRIDDYNSRI